LQGSENNPKSVKINVTAMVMTNTIRASSTKGETAPKSPMVAAILMSSSPVPMILSRKKAGQYTDDGTDYFDYVLNFHIPNYFF
jgi:hypothetical protein